MLNCSSVNEIDIVVSNYIMELKKSVGRSVAAPLKKEMSYAKQLTQVYESSGDLTKNPFTEKVAESLTQFSEAICFEEQRLELEHHDLSLDKEKILASE